MDGKMLRLVMVLVFALLGSTVLGLTPMGSPVPDLHKGQFDAGVDYSYGKMDVKLNHGFSPGGGPSFTMDNLKFHYVASNIGYGLTDNWELYFRLGGGSVYGSEGGGISFNSSDGYAVGFGTKAKLFQWDTMKWGGLFQILWAQANGKTKAGGASWDAEENLTEIQIALGPEYRMNEKAVLYGGPFFHILDGDFVAKRRTAPARINYDLDQSSLFGGYIGTAIDITTNVLFNIEYQHTGAADAIGLKLAYKF
ncbi:MAG: hypothetical protein WC374_00080 [Phycisphaerae bacterium]|jgi:hypothetical protein